MVADEVRRNRYLEQMGLLDKLKKQREKPPWHLNHLKAGDKFVGWIEHPDVSKGERCDLELVVTSTTEGEWESRRGDFASTVDINQDFPISYQAGPEKDEDMVNYIFHKFNKKWRNFDGPKPELSEMEYLGLSGLRLFFNLVAEVEGFPEEADFNQACADPSKGMTKAEFLKYIKGEDETYLDMTFPSIYTGRRVNFAANDFELDGDFVLEAEGVILGYARYMDRAGGTFSLELVRREKL